MEKEESLVDTIKTIIYAVLIAMVIRTFMFEPFKIPSGSMYSTLHVGDFLFVSKYTYGYSKYSLPFSLPLFEGRIWADAPARGDVVVFRNPQDNKTDFIKRVIGLPGDKIKLENGRLYINDKLVEREQIEDFVLRDEYGNVERYRQYEEILPEGKKHKILEISDNEEYDNVAEFVVPDNNYFMMGDNRFNSLDLRHSYSYHKESLDKNDKYSFWYNSNLEPQYINKSDILGTAIFRFWPPKRAGIL